MKLLDKKKKEIIFWAKELYDKGLVKGQSGNISYKFDKEKILITAHNSYLGYLSTQDILLLDLEGNILKSSNKTPTSEKKLHLAIYKKFPGIKVIVHAHPPFVTAFFHYFKKLQIFSFEAKIYFKKISVIPQKTPTVENIKPVINAFQKTNMVVLKNHGTVAIGRDFKSVVSLTQILEEYCKVNFFLRRI